jgi:hypothetical protein
MQVEQELGFSYEMQGGGHYQQICPKCRRALFGLAQGVPWREHLAGRAAEVESSPLTRHQ